MLLLELRTFLAGAGLYTWGGRLGSREAGALVGNLLLARAIFFGPFAILARVESVGAEAGEEGLRGITGTAGGGWTNWKG